MIQAQQVPADMVQAGPAAAFAACIGRHGRHDDGPGGQWRRRTIRQEQAIHFRQPPGIGIGLATDHHAIEASRELLPDPGLGLDAAVDDEFQAGKVAA